MVEYFIKYEHTIIVKMIILQFLYVT